MNKKTLLLQDLEKITKSIQIILQAFEFCYYLNYPKIDQDINEEHHKYILNSGFFSFTRYSLWRTTILELHKLLNDNKSTDKYNLHLLIRKFKNGGIYNSLGIEANLIQKWENNLFDKSNSIEEVKHFRFKVYAHTDKDYEDFFNNSKITLIETNSLIQTIINIVFEINQIVFDKHVKYEPIHSKKSVYNIINDILSKREDDRKKIIENFHRKIKK